MMNPYSTEKPVLRGSIEILKRLNFLTMQEVLRCLEFGCQLPLHRGVFGRVNTQGTYDPRIKARRRNPMLMTGMPDIMGFMYKRIYSEHFNEGYNMNCGTHFALECKSSTGKQSEAQEQYQKLFVASGGLYLIIRDPADIQKGLGL